MNLLQKASYWLGLEAYWPEASRQDGTNFRTNQVTLAAYQDNAIGAGTVLGLSAAWACVNLVAGTIASLPLVVYRMGRNGREVARDHPLYYILHDSPNAEQTALDFWEYESVALEIRGNAYAEKEISGTGRLIALHPLNPEGVSTKRLPNGDIEYRWTESGRQRVETRQKVLHISGFGGDPLGGMSTLSYGRKTFNLARSMNSAAGGLFENGVQTSGVMSTDMKLTGEQRKLAEELLQDKFVGAQNRGRPMLLDAGMKWQSISINPDDAQMLESRNFSIEEVCRFFQVPPHMVGHTEKASSWGTGIEQMTLGFVKYSLRKRLKRIEQALMKQLLTPQDRLAGVTIEFNLEGLLRGDSANRSAFYTAGLTNGWMTINEVRALENLPPVEGGDVPRMQMQNVPITEAGQAPPQAAAA